jgi:hypothetical protein
MIRLSFVVMQLCCAIEAPEPANPAYVCRG